MIETDQDIEAFFDVEDFAHLCTRKRVGESPLVFSAILGVEDRERLQQQSIAANRTLLAPSTVDLFRGDVVEVRDVSADPVALVGTFRVLRDAERNNDGRTASCPLSILIQ